MSRRVVVMPAIRCEHYNGSLTRANLEYVRYSMATWTHWCSHNGAEFMLMQEPLGGEQYQNLPPTVQRWLALEALLKQFGEDASFAFVDADTMVRWDTPNIFDLAGDEFTVVKDRGAVWVYKSIRAYQPFFPEVTLNWWEYFNAGVVLLNARHMPLIQSLQSFILSHKAELLPIFHTWQVGDDQTPFNFLVKRSGINVRYLDARFNMLHVAPLSEELFRLESNPAWATVPEDVPFDLPRSQLDFIDMGYIWHFTNIARAKGLIMARTWEHIRSAYPNGTQGQTPAELILRLSSQNA